jgi:hypothetical protein
MTTREPLAHPDALDRIRAPLAALALLAALAATQCGCGGAGALAGAAGVVKTTIDVIRQTRQVLCSPAWVPLVGPTNVGETEWIPKPAADASTAADAAGD